MIPALDGMRAVFLTWVMFVHAPDSAVPQALANAHRYWILGVDGFMAISGFLVTRSLLQSGSIREFMVRRVSRVLPPYYLTLALICAIAWLTKNGLYQNLAESWAQVLGFPLFVANYTIPTAHERIPAILQPYWSISFQEQFYVLLAVMFAWAATRGRLKVALFASGLASIALRLIFALWIWKDEYRGWNYEANLHLALDSMTWGCLAWLYYDELGWLWSTRARRWISSSLILGALVTVISARSVWHDSASMAILPIFRAPLLALFVRMCGELGTSIVGKILASSMMRSLGKVSYETYLLHPVIFAALEKLSLSKSPWFFAVAYPLAWIAGYAFHHAFGRPSQNWLKSCISSSGYAPRGWKHPV